MQNGNLSDININEILNTSISSDNLYAFAIWGTVGLVVFAFIYLYFGVKKASRGTKPEGSIIFFIKWALLFASAGFNVFFTYYVFLPAGQSIALAMAIVMGGVNLAEAYLVKLTIASWRHGLNIIFKIALVLIIPLFGYSLMAAGSAFTTMMNKNKDSLKASQLELSASNDRLNASKAKLKEVQAGEQGGFLLTALQTTKVTNSRGARVSFGRIKQSCDSGGYYAMNYPQLCNQYAGLRNGSYQAGDVARAEQVANMQSASEKLKMAQIIKDRPPEIMPTLLGFSLGFAFVGFVVSLALESAIVGVGFFEEIYIRPTVLPANISFKDKKLDWNEKEITQKGLKIDRTPSPHISFNAEQITSPFKADTSTVPDGIPTVPNSVPVPKQEHLKSVPIGSISTIGTGDVPKQEQGTERNKQAQAIRQTVTPDTGIKGENSNRFNALKEAVKKGEIKLTLRSIKTFKYGGLGMGTDTAKKYLEALKREQVGQPQAKNKTDESKKKERVAQ